MAVKEADSDSDRYREQLVEYLGRYLREEEINEIVNGDHSEYPGGIEGMEQWVLKGLSKNLEPVRPPSSSHIQYVNAVERLLNELPTIASKRMFQSELDIWLCTSSTQTSLWAEIELLEMGEEMFDRDYSEEILEAAEHLDESMSKVDLLEARGAISGEEWFERTGKLSE